MGELKDKIRAKFDPVALVALATLTPQGQPWVRYVMAMADPDLTIRCATALSSRKVAQIKANPEVHLTCGVASLETAVDWVQVQGRAEVRADKEARHAFWMPQFAAYFKGPDDPEFCVVTIKPYRIEYMTMTDMAPQVWQP